MSEESRLIARIALLEEAAQRRPTVEMYHHLARLCLDNDDGAGAARACFRAANIDLNGLNVESVVTTSYGGKVSAEGRVRRARLLIENGFMSSVVLAELALASAEVGDEDSVRSLLDYQRFFHCESCQAALSLPLRTIADTFLESQSIYNEPFDRAIRFASRYNAVGEESESNEIATLAKVLRITAIDFIERVRGAAREWHPFTASIPPDFSIGAWGVISGHDGFHKPHVHPRAWASGVLYISVPECTGDSSARIGWLRVGPPNYLKGSATAAWEERWIKPAQGLVVMMPGYFFHETFPMRRDDERICVAFDIVPRY